MSQKESSSGNGSIHGDNPGSDVPGVRHIELDHAVKSKKEARRDPRVKEVVDRLHEEGMHVAIESRRGNPTVVIWAARHRWQLLGTAMAVGAAGAVGIWYTLTRRGKH